MPADKATLIAEANEWLRVNSYYPVVHLVTRLRDALSEDPPHPTETGGAGDHIPDVSKKVEPFDLEAAVKDAMARYWGPTPIKKLEPPT